jgi:hypothetical protein
MKNSKVYGFLATAALLVGVSFLIYCGGGGSGNNPEGNLAQSDPPNCHANGSACIYDNDCCAVSGDQNVNICYKKKSSDSSGTCQPR